MIRLMLRPYHQAPSSAYSFFHIHTESEFDSIPSDSDSDPCPESCGAPREIVINVESLTGYESPLIPPSPAIPPPPKKHKPSNNAELKDIVKLIGHRAKLCKQMANDPSITLYITPDLDLFVNGVMSKLTCSPPFAKLFPQFRKGKRKYTREVESLCESLLALAGPTSGPSYFGTGIRRIEICPHFCLAYDGSYYGDVDCVCDDPNNCTCTGQQLATCPRCGTHRKIRRRRTLQYSLRFSTTYRFGHTSRSGF